MSIKMHKEGWYVATGKVFGILVCGFGITHAEALADALGVKSHG